MILDDVLLDSKPIPDTVPRTPRRGIISSPPSSESASSSSSSSSSRRMTNIPFTQLLRDAGVLSALCKFMSWNDAYAALCTCRAARSTFDRSQTKSVWLRRYVPGYARGLDAPFVPLVELEHLVLFMASQAEPLHRYPALALALLSGAALGPPSPEDDVRAHKLEQLALAHTRMVLHLRARAPPLGADGSDDAPPPPRAPPAAERELAFPAPLAYFGEGAAPPANTGTTPPPAAAPTSSSTASSAPPTLRHREPTLQKTNSNRLSRIFSAAPKAPPPAPQRDKRFWEDMRRERRVSRHVHSQSLSDVESGRVRAARQSMYGLRALGPGGSDFARSMHDPALASSRARALVLRLFVPCAWLDADALAECESQLRDEGFWSYLQPGDVVCNLGYVPESDAQIAWVVYTGARLQVWTLSDPPPVAPDAAMRLPSPFYFAHLAPNGGGSQPPSGLTSRASMYSVAGPLSASTPTLGNQAPFFAALSLHRRPGSSGAGGPPSAWSGFGGGPAPSMRTTSSVTPSSGDPRWILRIPPLPPAQWILAQQHANVPVKPRMGMPAEVRVRRHVWLAIVDLRRISVPPVPPLPEWARAQGQSKITPSQSGPALAQSAGAHDAMGPGWHREWVLEAAGTPEGRVALEAVLSGAGGDREWIIQRDKCASGRLWMRLVDWPAHDPEADGMTSPHERLAMTPTLPPAHPVRALEVDFGRPLEFSVAAAGTARAQQQQMQLNQPPQRRVVSQPPPPPRRLSKTRSKRDPSPSPAPSSRNPRASSQSLTMEDDPQKTPMPSAWQQAQPWSSPAPSRYSSPPAPSVHASPPPPMYASPPPSQFHGPPPSQFHGPPPAQFHSPPPSQYQNPPSHYHNQPPSQHQGPPPSQYANLPPLTNGPPTRYASPPPALSPSSTSSSVSQPPTIHTTPAPHQPQRNASPPRSPHALSPSPVKRTSSPLNPKNHVAPSVSVNSTSSSSLHSPSSASLSSSVATPPPDVPASKPRGLPPGAAPPQPQHLPPLPPKSQPRRALPSENAPPPPLPPKLATSHLKRDSAAPTSPSQVSPPPRSGSVFGPATGLLPPPPPPSKTPSRKLTRRRIVSALIPGL